MFINQSVAFSFVSAMMGVITTGPRRCGYEGPCILLDSNMKILRGSLSAPWTRKPTIGASQPASHADQVPAAPLLSTATRSTEGPEQPVSLSTAIPSTEGPEQPASLSIAARSMEGPEQPVSLLTAIPSPSEQPVPLSTAIPSTEGPEQRASKEGPSEISYFKAYAWKNESVNLSRALSCKFDGLLLPFGPPDANKSALHPFELLLGDTQPSDAEIDNLFPFEVCAMGDNSANEIEGCPLDPKTPALRNEIEGCPLDPKTPALRIEVGMFLTDFQQKYGSVAYSRLKYPEKVYQFSPHSDGFYNLTGAWEVCLPVSSCALYDGLRWLGASSMNDVKIRFSGKLCGKASSAASVRFVVREVSFTSRVIYDEAGVAELGDVDSSVKLIGRDAKKFGKSEDSIYWYDKEVWPQCNDGPLDLATLRLTREERVSTFYSLRPSPCESKQGCEIRAEWKYCKRSCPALKSAIALGQ